MGQFVHMSLCSDIGSIDKCENGTFPLWWFSETSEFMYLFASAQILGVLRAFEIIPSRVLL